MTGLCRLAILSLFCAAALCDDYTQTFYENTQYAPILTYECYRNGVTLEPEDTVNFTIFWDGTQPGNNTGKAMIWYAPNGTVDQYTTGTFTYVYDEGSSSILVDASGTEERFILPTEPYNGLGYYVNLTITSANNRAVLKLYDVDSRCGNAAALLCLVDPEREKGFIFFRDIPEPTQKCTSRRSTRRNQDERHQPQRSRFVFLPTK